MRGNFFWPGVLETVIANQISTDDDWVVYEGDYNVNFKLGVKKELRSYKQIYFRIYFTDFASNVGALSLTILSIAGFVMHSYQTFF